MKIPRVIFPGTILVLLLGSAGLARGSEIVSIAADHLIYSRASSKVVATGHVVVDFADGYAEGVSATYDLGARTIDSAGALTFRTDQYHGTAQHAQLDPARARGRFFAAMITGDDGTLLWGDEIEQTGEHTFRITNGGFTPCDCPQAAQPAWSVHVREATIEWRKRVRFRHARFDARRVPILYAPAGILPLPEARQTGLLFPRLGWDRALGWRVRPGAFIAMGDHADSTLWFDYASRAGLGPLGEIRAVSRTGRYSLGGSWFREFSDADILYENGVQVRAASTRWDVAGRAAQHLPGALTFDVDGRIVSDDQRDRDFADNLASLTRSSTESQVRLYGAWRGPGAAAARIGVAQSLIGSGASGARIPSLRWLPDPVAFGTWPVRLRSSLRYDRIVQQDANLGDVWQPAAWLPTADRLIAQVSLGASVDPLPGWFIDADLGGLTMLRDVRDWQVATTSPYTVQATEHPSQLIAAGVAQLRSEIRLQARSTRMWQRLYAGSDLNWLRPSATLASPIESIDQLAWQTWIVPHITWRAAVSDVSLWWRADVPIRYDAGFQIVRLLAQQAALSANAGGLRVRLWRDWARNDWPLAEATIRGGPWKGQRFTVGFARRTSAATNIDWDVNRGLPEAPAIISALPYREGWLRWDWEIWRLFGAIEARRRFPVYPGEAAAWNSQIAELGYHDPCDCLRLAASWQNLPGSRGDRVDLRIDFALLGGVGTNDRF